MTNRPMAWFGLMMMESGPVCREPGTLPPDTRLSAPSEIGKIKIEQVYLHCSRLPRIFVQCVFCLQLYESNK